MTISEPMGDKRTTAFKLRPLLFKIHLYIAVSIGLYVAIMGFTGTIMAFEIEISRLARADVTYVVPAPQRLSLTEIGKAVANAFPGQKIDAPAAKENGILSLAHVRLQAETDQTYLEHLSLL